MPERFIISGEAGKTWENNTERVRYQFIAALQNTCGVCLQYHLKIGNAWPIPIHYNCRCIARMIKPGAKAPYPFCNYRELLDGFDKAQKAAAIGASNYKLLKSGLATWDDIVTPNRVRDFREVVAKKRLSIETMTKHGVSKYQATKAFDAVHTEEHQHVERQRRELLNKISGAGLAQDTLVGELSNRLANRVIIAPGPKGSDVGRPQDTGGPAWGGGRLPGTGPSSAGDLARLIAGWRPPTKPKPATPAIEPKKKEKEPEKPTTTPPEPETTAESKPRWGKLKDVPIREEPFPGEILPPPTKATTAEETPPVIAPRGTPAYDAHLRNMASRRDADIRRIAAQHGMNPDELRVAIDAKLQDVISQSDFYVRVETDVLTKVLETRFKSQFETNSSNGMLDNGRREQVESLTLGIPENTHREQRPIYGYVSAKDFGSFHTQKERAVSQYGNVAVKLRDNIRQRATVTFGDSLNYSHNVAATHATAVKVESIPSIPSGVLSKTVDELRSGIQFDREYIEAQYHGQLTTKDIAEVAFPSTPSPDIIRTLAERGIPWRVKER